MLTTILVLLIVLWLLGMVSSYTLGGFIHILLILAIAIVLIRVIQGRRPSDRGAAASAPTGAASLNPAEAGARRWTAPSAHLRVPGRRRTLRNFRVRQSEFAATLCIGTRHNPLSSAHPPWLHRLSWTEGTCIPTTRTRPAQASARHRRRADGDRLAQDGHRAGAVRPPGYEVRVASHGARAEELFQSWRPAVVLLDLLLPDTDGIELLRRMKAHRPDAGNHRHQRAGHDQARARGRPGRRVLLHREIGSRSGRHHHDSRARAGAARRAPAARAAQGTGPQPVLVLEHHRQEQEDARALRARRGGGGQRRQHPDPGRERHRQGADRQRAAPAQPARQGPVHQDQLRGDSQGPDRVGALRLQEGRVHRRAAGQGRACSSSRAAAR